MRSVRVLDAMGMCVCVHVGWDRQEITGGDGLGGGKAGFKQGRGQIKLAP